MDFTEKEITALRKESVQKKNNNIYAPYIYVADERLEFTMQDIIEPYVRMMLPKTFLNLPSAIAKQMYPSEFRPAVIKTNPSLTVNFAFTFFEEKLPMKEVPDCAHYYEKNVSGKPIFEKRKAIYGSGGNPYSGLVFLCQSHSNGANLQYPRLHQRRGADAVLYLPHLKGAFPGMGASRI